MYSSLYDGLGHASTTQNIKVTDHRAYTVTLITLSIGLYGHEVARSQNNAARELRIIWLLAIELLSV